MSYDIRLFAGYIPTYGKYQINTNGAIKNM